MKREMHHCAHSDVIYNSQNRSNPRAWHQLNEGDAAYNTQTHEGTGVGHKDKTLPLAKCAWTLRALA